MKRNTMTQSLKRALAFALFCLCIFVYSQQTSVLGSTAVAEEEEQCCKHCGWEAGCISGTEWLQSAWSHCEMKYDDDYRIKGCEVDGKYCNCS